MKRLFFAVVAILVLSWPAFARTNWQGEMMITAVTNPACSNDGWAVGAHGLTTLLPSDIDNNGPDSFVAFHLNRRNAYSLRVIGGDLGAGAKYQGARITSAGNFSSFSGKISKFTMKPSLLTASTQFVTVTGTLTNWAGQVGCTVSFDASYVLRR